MEKGEWIGQGRTADAFVWGQDRILKLYQPHMPPESVKQEFVFTQAARTAGLPVPAADDLVEVEGRPGILFERVSGPSMLKVMITQPWKIASLASLLAELHARVHRCEVPVGLRTQRQQIESAIQSCPDLSASAIQAVLAHLYQRLQGQQLCHGDFHPDNVLMTPGGPVIIDWMTGCRGNPLGDASRTIMIFRTSGLPPGPPSFFKHGFRLFRRLVLSSYQKRYLQIHPAAPQELAAWQLPLLAARLREVTAYPREKQMILAQVLAMLEKGA